MENDLKSNLAYKGSFYLFMFCSVFGAFISYYLWMAIYGSSKTGVLGGLTQKEMVTYIFMTYVTANTAKLSLSNLISNDVREGTVAMTLIKPIDYRMSLISRAVGGAIIINMVIYFISVMFSFLLYVLYNFCFGMIAFTNTYMFGVKRIEEAIFLYLVFSQIPNLDGWTFNELIFIYGFAQIPRGIDHLLTDNIWILAWNLVVSGRFDSYKLRPMNLYLQVIFEQLQPDALGELLVGSILVVKSCMKGIVIIDATHICLFIVSMIAGSIIYTGVKLLFASFAFWMKISGPVLFTAYSLSDFAKYPVNIYQKGIKFIITWIIPFAYVAYIPATYFLKANVNPLTTIGVECVIAVVLFTVAYAVFNKGTKVYESAGN